MKKKANQQLRMMGFFPLHINSNREQSLPVLDHRRDEDSLPNPLRHLGLVGRSQAKACSRRRATTDDSIQHGTNRNLDAATTFRSG